MLRYAQRRLYYYYSVFAVCNISMAYKHSHINTGREGHKGYPCPLTQRLKKCQVKYFTFFKQDKS